MFLEEVPRVHLQELVLEHNAGSQEPKRKHYFEVLLLLKRKFKLNNTYFSQKRHTSNENASD